MEVELDVEDESQDDVDGDVETLTASGCSGWTPVACHAWEDARVRFAKRRCELPTRRLQNRFLPRGCVEEGVRGEGEQPKRKTPVF